MTAALRAEERAAPYLVAPPLTDHLDTFASAPEGFKRLRELVLNLAVRGRLTTPSHDVATKNAGELASQLPRGWVVAQFGDCAEVVRGITFPAGEKSKSPENGRIACLRTANIQDEIQWEDLLYVRESFLARPNQLVCAGDLVMSMANSKELVGKVAQVKDVKFPCAIGGFLAIIRGARLSNDYLLILLRSPAIRAALIDSSTQTTNIANISLSRLRPLTVGVPPLSEQSRIVAKVEELMALIAALEAKVGAGETARGRLLDALLAALADSPDAAATADAWAQLAPHFDLLLQTPADVDRLQQTLLQLAVKGRLVPQDPNDEPADELLKRIRAEKERLVAEGKIKRDKSQASIGENEYPFAPPSGWQWARFGDLFQVSGGVTLGRKMTGKRTVSYPYLRVANVQRGALDLNQIKEVEIAEDELDRYCLRRDDLLITEGGDWDKVGRTAIWCAEIEPCLHQNHVFRARRISRDMNVEWLALFMNSAIAMAYFQESAKQTTNLASINMGELKHCAVPLPPLPEQSRIVAAVAALTALCDRLRERLAARRVLSAKLAAALTETALQ